MNYFYALDVFRYQSKSFEFHERGVRGKTRDSQRLIPRRYKIGSCTIAIVLLKSFPPVLLPPSAPVSPSSGWRERDLDSYNRMYELLRSLKRQCNDSGHAGGLVQAGDYGGLGILIFATDSPVDQAIAGWRPDDGLTNETLSSEV